MCHTISWVDKFMQQLLLLAHLHLLGIIKAYVICYEIQQHGLLHAHIILWVVEMTLKISQIKLLHLFLQHLMKKKIYPTHIKYKHTLQNCNEKNSIHVEINVI